MDDKSKFRAAMAVIAVFAVLLLAVAPGSSAGPGVEAQSTPHELLHNFDLEGSSPTPNPGVSYVGDHGSPPTDYKKAVAFTTGSNDLGYTLVKLSGELSATADDIPQVEIHADDNGSPSDTALHTLTVDIDTLSLAENELAEVYFDAPSGTTLEKDSTYWAVSRKSR